MKDHRKTPIMSSRSSKGRLSNYELEMDHAFTLIFHNIKRLQDGVLSKSDPNLAKNFSQEEAKPAVSRRVKIPVRKRSGSEPYVGFVSGVQNDALILDRKSGSLHDLSEVGRSPTPRRKVRFADDYATEGKSRIKTHKLSPLASKGGFLNYRQDSHNHRPSDTDKASRECTKRIFCDSRLSNG